eukprot:258225-Amphidinium_carterae.1
MSSHIIDNHYKETALVSSAGGTSPCIGQACSARSLTARHHSQCVLDHQMQPASSVQTPQHHIQRHSCHSPTSSAVAASQGSCQNAARH